MPGRVSLARLQKKGAGLPLECYSQAPSGYFWVDNLVVACWTLTGWFEQSSRAFSDQFCWETIPVSVCKSGYIIRARQQFC